MKKPFLSLFLMGAIALLMSGCMSTNTITEFDKDGHVTKVTETKEAVVDQVTKSTKDKTCYVWSKGWVAKMSGSASTTEDPTPTLVIKACNVDQGVLTLHKDQQNMDKVADVIRACNSGALSVTAQGINSNGSSAATNAADSDKKTNTSASNAATNEAVNAPPATTTTANKTTTGNTTADGTASTGK